MLKKTGIGVASACMILGLFVPSASALTNGLGWEIADAFANNPTTGTNTPYEWFVSPIKLSFDLEYRDGTWADGRPYGVIKGTDASPNGHCLQIDFTPGDFPSEYLQLYVKDHATNQLIYSFIGSYSMRLWVNKNTGGAGSTLPWTIYVLPAQGDTSYSGEVAVSLRRIELGKAACATNPGPDPWSENGVRWPYVTIEGNSTAYTVTTGHF